MNATAIKTLWLALLIVLLDQVTKLWAVSVLAEGESYAVMNHLNFTLVYNYGAAFSFLADMGGWQRLFFTAVAIGVSGFLIYWLSKLPKVWTLEVLGLNMILGGAIGNVIDRVYQGKVTDFVDFYIGAWHYATFNIADVGVTVGAILLIYFEFFVRPKQEKMQEQLAAEKRSEPQQKSDS